MDNDPVKAAKDQCDKHVVKMVLESSQMLSTAHRLLDGDNCIAPSVLYKIAHKGHPCTLWTMESSKNYQWLYEHFVALCDEYTHRYGKTHLCDTKLRTILATLPKSIVKSGITNFKLAMGSNPECIDHSDPVKSYRLYYQTKQTKFDMKWTKRNMPKWFTKYTISI